MVRGEQSSPASHTVCSRRPGWPWLDRRPFYAFAPGPTPCKVLPTGDCFFLRRQIEKVVLAADHHRRVRARRQALLLDERERAVGGGLAGLDPQLLLDVVQDLVPAAQHARDVGADHQLVPPVPGAVEHRVERDDAEHVRRRDVDGARHQLHDRIGKVSELVLGDVQDRQQSRLLVRITRKHPLDALLRLR
jgi:hypothetical protein